MKNKNSQVKAVKSHLERYGHITASVSVNKYGAYRLSSIIHILRHKKGMDIKTNIVRGTNQFGNPTHYADYVYADWKKECKR